MWEDNFDGAGPTLVYGAAYLAANLIGKTPSLLTTVVMEMRNGLLILKGIVNDNTEADAAQYLTGGLWTKDKRAFHGGRIEVRARLHGAKEHGLLYGHCLMKQTNTHGLWEEKWTLWNV